MRVPTTPAHLFFLRKKTPASQKARVGTSTVSLGRGANREVKERVKGKASRVQGTRIGSALVCVRRNVQHLELKLSKSTRFVLVTVVMVAAPTGCVVSPPPLFSQNIMYVCMYACMYVCIEVSNIILSRSERRAQPLFAPSRTQCKTFGAHLSLKTRLNHFFCRLRLPDRINLSSHPCKSRAEVSSYA